MGSYNSITIYKVEPAEYASLKTEKVLDQEPIDYEGSSEKAVEKYLTNPIQDKVVENLSPHSSSLYKHSVLKTVLQQKTGLEDEMLGRGMPDLIAWDDEKPEEIMERMNGETKDIGMADDGRPGYYVRFDSPKPPSEALKGLEFIEVKAGEGKLSSAQVSWIHRFKKKYDTEDEIPVKVAKVDGKGKVI